VGGGISRITIIAAFAVRICLMTRVERDCNATNVDLYVNQAQTFVAIAVLNSMKDKGAKHPQKSRLVDCAGILC